MRPPRDVEVGVEREVIVNRVVGPALVGDVAAVGAGVAATEEDVAEGFEVVYSSLINIGYERFFY